MGSYVGHDAENSGSTHEGRSFPTHCRNEDFLESDDEISEPRAETIQEFDKSNCVVVGRENLSVAAPKEDEARSYKKKFQKAFLSKRSARKQEYKQLAVQQGYVGSGESQDTAESEMLESSSDGKNSQPHGASESGWELL